jgi:hypothetical protein
MADETEDFVESEEEEEEMTREDKFCSKFYIAAKKAES